ncbi:hypothetical protein [Paractinoplanes hotanensis]|uniref:GNAT family N-acetyltransferase n=1 Tax=Paractinoplanes hotanensis TaxID=2906497 RepID=A0ABT0Y0H5_9ACTN|nr:hypothetical protein [Actinoplanes hotanensis]MCM4078977.1 hypothetical protein [Actinoplanes hotanensis]
MAGLAANAAVRGSDATCEAVAQGASGPPGWGVPWSTCTDVRVFLAAAGDFLATDPVGHTILLTEAAYLEATAPGGGDSAQGATGVAGEGVAGKGCRPAADDDRGFGWWTDAFGVVGAAFVRAPNHPPVLTPVPDAALPSLVDVLAGDRCLGVDGRDAERVASAWRERAGVVLEERFRVALCRLIELRAGVREPGRSRRATPADRELVVGWFHELMAANPGDTSDLAYVIDEPLGYGGLTLWEVDGRPVAMAGRSRVVAGMTRVSASYAPDGDTGAVFAAACEEAARVAEHVLVLTADVAAHRALGFEKVLDRVTLEVVA